MFTKLTRSGGHTYVQLAESFRDDTGRPRVQQLTAQVIDLYRGALQTLHYKRVS